MIHGGGEGNTACEKKECQRKGIRQLFHSRKIFVSSVFLLVKLHTKQTWFVETLPSTVHCSPNAVPCHPLPPPSSLFLFLLCPTPERESQRGRRRREKGSVPVPSPLFSSTPTRVSFRTGGGGKGGKRERNEFFPNKGIENTVISLLHQFHQREEQQQDSREIRVSA